MKLKWQQAPVKTQWGDDMVVASVAIDKDHTLSLYCERDQATKVETMFVQTAQQEPVVLPCCGFTDARAVRWNFYNKVVQCHNCGQVYTSPPAQRTWLGLERSDMPDGADPLFDDPKFIAGMVYAANKLMEKNT